MGNLPNITQTEIATIAAAVLLLFIAPAVLAWSDERQRRRAQRERAIREDGEVRAPTTEPPSYWSNLPEGEAQVPLPEDLALGGEPEVIAETPMTAMPPPPPSDAAAVAAWEPDIPVAAPAEPAVSAPDAPAAATPQTHDATVPPALELRPLDGSLRHQFRLADLHKAQLPDWPPAVIRNDPERLALWGEVEAAVKPYEGALTTAPIFSPYPARSSCVGAAEVAGSCLRVRYLLFPVLWPVSQNQAVAQAVFEIDRTTGEIRGWVDALRLQELTAENQREILEGGGQL